MATLNPKVQAWKDKWDKEFSDLQTKHRAAEQADWEANQSTYKAQGYHREEDPNNYWGSKWSYKGNNSDSDSGSNDLSGSGTSGSVSDLTSSINETINSAYGFKAGLAVGDGLFGTNNKNPLAGTFSGNSNKAGTSPTAFKGFSFVGQNSYNTEEDFMKDFENQYKQYVLQNKSDFGQPHFSEETGMSSIRGLSDIQSKNLQGYNNALASVKKSYNYNKPSLFLSDKWFGELVGLVDEKPAYTLINKNGGTMNKVKYFSQGGAPTQTTQNLMSPEQELKAAVAFLRDVYAGKEKAVTSFLQILAAAKKGVPEAKRMMELLVQASKMMQSAKWGSKLEYIRSLKFAKGGKSCPVCEQQKVEMKKCGGKKAKKRYFGGWL